MNNRMIEKLLAPIRRRLSLIVARGIVTLVNDGTKRQNIQVIGFADEALDNMERFQNYGLTSVPPKSSEVIAVATSGMRSGLVAVSVEDKECRPKNLEELSVMLYHLEGHGITLTKDGKIRISSTDVILEASNSFTIISPETLIQGPLHVTGGISTDLGMFADGGITSNGVITGADLSAGGFTYLGHYHNAGGSNTSPPIG